MSHIIFFYLIPYFFLAFLFFLSHYIFFYLILFFFISSYFFCLIRCVVCVVWSSVPVRLPDRPFLFFFISSYFFHLILYCLSHSLVLFFFVSFAASFASPDRSFLLSIISLYFLSHFIFLKSHSLFFILCIFFSERIGAKEVLANRFNNLK